VQKFVVGLGNPGSKYQKTRHNVGFDVLDYLHAKYGSPATRTMAEGKISSIDLDKRKSGTKRLSLIWPQTFMNRSGRCVQSIVRFYKIDITTDLMIVCDDLSLPLGKIRIRPKGSAGGQKGLADILQLLGSQEIPRLRIGIDSVPDRWDAADFVLSPFHSEDRVVVDAAVERACSAIEVWCRSGLQDCMNQFNA
jgi:peptidyl-tRNA hydrolase, PTH1 family